MQGDAIAINWSREKRDSVSQTSNEGQALLVSDYLSQSRAVRVQGQPAGQKTNNWPPLAGERAGANARRFFVAPKLYFTIYAFS